MGQYAFWEEAPISSDKALFDLNVFSLVNLNRIVLNYFKNERGRQGHLAVVSSLAGKFGVPYLTPYTPTKYALNVRNMEGFSSAGINFKLVFLFYRVILRV